MKELLEFLFLGYKKKPKSEYVLVKADWVERVNKRVRSEMRSAKIWEANYRNKPQIQIIKNVKLELPIARIVTKDDVPNVLVETELLEKEMNNYARK